MHPSTVHACRFRKGLVWSEWNTRGELREREARRVARCVNCGRVRPVRKQRPPELLEREAVAQSPMAVSGEIADLAGMLAASALRRASRADLPRFRMRTILERLGRRGWAASIVEPALERLVGAGFLRAGYRLRGSQRVLDYVVVPQPEKLYEAAHPGERAERQARLAEARAALETVTHPVAQDIRGILQAADAERLSSRAIRGLAAVARHVESGDVLSANVFSALYLGGAKELRRVRARLERTVGPLESLGIRDGGATLLVGGTGGVNVLGTALSLACLRPFVGLPRQRVMDAIWDIPGAGVLVIENMAAFEAACAGDVGGLGDWLFVWSGGYPARTVRCVVEAAARKDLPLRVWADLDLDGIRIARLVGSWAEGCWLPWRMSPSDVHAAAVRRPLTARAREAIQADLRASPVAPLADTLRALLEIDATIEQEVFVGQLRDLQGRAPSPRLPTHGSP